MIAIIRMDISNAPGEIMKAIMDVTVLSEAVPELEVVCEMIAASTTVINFALQEAVIVVAIQHVANPTRNNKQEIRMLRHNAQ